MVNPHKDRKRIYIIEEQEIYRRIYGVIFDAVSLFELAGISDGCGFR